MGIALLLVASGFLWIIMAPHYDTTFLVNNYTSTSSQAVTPITVEGTLSASLDMPYAIILMIIGFVFAFLAILVGDKQVKVE
jgi:hypothetical protein